jgi:hypothetical protein
VLYANVVFVETCGTLRVLLQCAAIRLIVWMCFAAAVHEAVILQLSVSEQVKQVKPVELFGVFVLMLR